VKAKPWSKRRKRWGTKVVDTSLLELWSACVRVHAESVPRSRRREANSSDASCLCGTWQPRCGLSSGSDPIVRADQSRSGHRMTQEANAVRSKGHGKAIRYNRTDRGSNFALLRKRADVSQVIDPKTDVRGLKPGGKVRCSWLQM